MEATKHTHAYTHALMLEKSPYDGRLNCRPAHNNVIITTEINTNHIQSHNLAFFKKTQEEFGFNDNQQLL